MRRAAYKESRCASPLRPAHQRASTRAVVNHATSLVPHRSEGAERVRERGDVDQPKTLRRAVECLRAVAVRDEKDRRAVVVRGDEFLLDAADLTDFTRGADLTGTSDNGPAGQVPGCQLVHDC